MQVISVTGVVVLSGRGLNIYRMFYTYYVLHRYLLHMYALCVCDVCVICVCVCDLCVCAVYTVKLSVNCTTYYTAYYTCTPYSMRCTQFIIRCILYSVHIGVHYIVHIVCSTLFLHICYVILHCTSCCQS